ncbi:MAG: phosphotransferase family protein [Novosphingobium sp.]|nr:phosphotransferase family protein [Novosphingobium sp.]
METADEALAMRLARYLEHKQPEVADVAVSNLARIHGGSSQETFRFDAGWNEGERHTSHRLILRRAPEAGLVNAEHDLEFKVYSALEGRNVPVPRAWFLELDPQWLDRPFFIMDMVDGKPGHFFGSDDPYDGKGTEVASSFWKHLGTLAAQDHRGLGLTELRNGDEDGRYWQRELAYWEAKLDVGEAVVEPVVRGVIRWLRANPPPEPAAPSIIHGDYRSGNFLFLPDGAISAVLDWEMCHIGDALEDIAWAIDSMWTMERHLPLDDGLAIWEQASGRVIDRDALDWWRLFVTVKACAIWTTAEASFQDGTSREMIVALTAMRANSFHRRAMLDRMAELGAMG